MPPETPGGVESVTQQISSGLADLGCTVAVLRPNPSRPAVDYARGATVYALDTSTRARIDASLSDSIDSFNPDIVHVAGARWPVASRVNAVVQSRPWVLSLHNMPTLEARLGRFYGHNHIYYYARDARFLPNTLLWVIGLRRWRFARVICHSCWVQSRLVRLGCRRDRIALVPLGQLADASRCGRGGGAGSPFDPQGHPRLLTVAGLIHHKGIHDSLRAVAALAGPLPQLRYLVMAEDATRRTQGTWKGSWGSWPSVPFSFVYDASEGRSGPRCAIPICISSRLMRKAFA